MEFVKFVLLGIEALFEANLILISRENINTFHIQIGQKGRFSAGQNLPENGPRVVCGRVVIDVVENDDNDCFRLCEFKTGGEVVLERV
jgi:hypothetical protein